MKRPSAGFTLIELMVVVAIIGVLTSLAVINLTRGPGLSDTAQAISARFREAKRRAAAMGPINEAVMFNPANAGLAERTRITVDETSIVVEVLKEDEAADPADPPPDTYDWYEMVKYYLPTDHVISGYRTVAELDPGASPITSLSGTDHTLLCYPSGACEGVTLYIEDTRNNQRKRIALLPLMGSPLIFKDW